MTELCFHFFVYFECVAIYIFGFHQKQCACNQSVDKSLKDEIHIRSVVKPVQIFMARNRVSKSCLMAELYFHGFVRQIFSPYAERRKKSERYGYCIKRYQFSTQSKPYGVKVLSFSIQKFSVFLSFTFSVLVAVVSILSVYTDIPTY